MEIKDELVRVMNEKGGRNMKEGFTIVELSLSMVFISILSLAVVFVIMGAVSSYHKSITLNRVDDTGSSLVDDMQASVRAASSSSLALHCTKVYGESGTAANDCKSDNAKRFVSVSRTGKVTASGGTTMDNVPLFGAFCTGTYSYIWNSGYYFTGGYSVSVGPSKLTYFDKSKQRITKQDYRLLKVRDVDRAVCVAALRVNGNTVQNNYKVTNINNGGDTFNIAVNKLFNEGDSYLVDEEPTDLLANNSDGGLAIYDLNSSISEQSVSARNAYYYTSFILGTVSGGINVMANGNFCKAPEDYSGNAENGNFDYCAINKFNFAALANGGLNEN